MWRYFIWLIAVFGLILILVLLIVPKSNKKPAPAVLYSYADSNAIARLTIDGPINAEQDHQSVQITVGKDDVQYDQFVGYNSQVVNQQISSSSVNAYNNFLHALYHAGYTEGNSSSRYSDELGYCPLGDRYTFEFIDGGNEIQRFWATNCGTPKTYLGNVSLTLQLFQNQVPNYDMLTQNISF